MMEDKSMRRKLVVPAIFLLLVTLTGLAGAQDKLSGRWEGKLASPQGERPTVMIFKKNGEGYTGRSMGLRPGTEVELKDVKLDGSTVTAKADLETPQAVITINYSFKLDGETLKGQGSLDFGGQSMALDIDLKRVSADTEGALTAAAPAGAAAGGQQGAAGGAAGGQQRQQRANVEQPQQKQSLEYFAGKWNFKYLGRESGLWAAPRQGTVTISKKADGKSADAAVQGTNDAGAYKETWMITFDEATKMMTWVEKLSSGATITAKGDWTSPISIRFTIDPVKIKGQNLKLKRTLSVVSAHSFTVTEELSEDNGPFVRLGSAVYSREMAK